MADGSIDRNPVGAPQPQPDLQATADLERLKKMFQEAQDLTQQARSDSLLDLDYYDGRQWTAAELNALRARKQPDIVINRIKPAVNGIIGVSERGKSEPRAFPRTPQDEDSADVATDVLRYIADHARFHRLKQDCFFDMLVPGTGACLIGIGADNQVELVQIRWEEFFADPRSRRRDFKDARYLGIAKWMYADDVGALYPDKQTEIQSYVESGSGVPVDNSFLDRPNGSQVWADRIRKRLLVVEIYYKEAGTWTRCVYCGSDILEVGPSPYQDHKGKPDCPIEAQSAYVEQGVERNNARYGVVRDMRGPQDEINKRRSKLLHLISVSQIEAVDPSAIDVNLDTARAEAARPDGVIPFGWRKVSTSDMARGQIELLQEAKSEMERMGPNPAVLGRAGEDQSGRALLARQQAGLVELALLYGGLEDWELRVYRQCWGRAKQFWRAPMYIRVTDDEAAPKFVGLNGAPPPPQMAQEAPPMGQPMQPGQTAQMPPGGPPAEPQAPQLPNVGGYKNALAEMDVDIILDTTPDAGTVAQEQFAELIRLAGSNPAWGQQLTLLDALELSSIPRKRALVDRMKQRQQAQQQVAGEAAELAKGQAEADLEKTKAETDLTGAKAATEMMKPHVDAATAFEAAQQPAAGDTGDRSVQPDMNAGPPPIG